MPSIRQKAPQQHVAVPFPTYITLLQYYFRHAMSRRCGNDNGVDSMRQRQLAFICNQRIALLNNLCRHHCAVSLNGFDNIDS